MITDQPYNSTIKMNFRPDRVLFGCSPHILYTHRHHINLNYVVQMIKPPDLEKPLTRSFHLPFSFFHSSASLQDLSLTLFILALIKFAKSPGIITKWSFWAVTNVQSAEMRCN